MDMADLLAEGIGPEEQAKLCEAFVTCAEYENRLWDELYRSTG